MACQNPGRTREGRNEKFTLIISWTFPKSKADNKLIIPEAQRRENRVNAKSTTETYE